MKRNKSAWNLYNEVKRQSKTVITLILSTKGFNAHHSEVSELVTPSQDLCGSHFQALGPSQDLQQKFAQKHISWFIRQQSWPLPGLILLICGVSFTWKWAQGLIIIWKKKKTSYNMLISVFKESGCTYYGWAVIMSQPFITQSVVSYLGRAYALTPSGGSEQEKQWDIPILPPHGHWSNLRIFQSQISNTLTPLRYYHAYSSSCAI